MNTSQVAEKITGWVPHIFPLTHKPLGFSVSGVTEQAIKQAAQMLGQKGGMVRSKAKAKAARKNGKKGGRPRKKAA